MDMGLEGWVRLSCELRLPRGQHSFEFLLGLTLLCFASSLLKTHFSGKSSFIHAKHLLVPLDQTLHSIIPHMLPSLAGVNDRGGAPDCTDGCEPAPALPR